MSNHNCNLGRSLSNGTSIFLSAWIPADLNATSNLTNRYVRQIRRNFLIWASAFVGISCFNPGSYSAIADDSSTFGKHKVEQHKSFTIEEIENLRSDEIIVQFKNEKRTLTKGVQQRMQLLSMKPFNGHLHDISIPADNQPIVSWGFGTGQKMGVAEINPEGVMTPLVPLKYVARSRSENLAPGQFYDDLTRGNFWHYTGASAINAKGEIFLSLGRCDPNAIVKYVPEAENDYGQENEGSYGQESNGSSIERNSESYSPGKSHDEQRNGRFIPILEIDSAHDMDIYKFDPEAIYISLYYQIYRYEFPDDGKFLATCHLAVQGKTPEVIIDFEAITPERWIVHLHDPKKQLKSSYRTILLDLTTNTYHEFRELKPYMHMGVNNDGDLICLYSGEVRTYRLLGTP